jgi:curved DNA-binding protein CbpA
VNQSHYDVLCVPREATPLEIKAAFRRLARKHHPDKNPGDASATERYQRIQRAYDVLSDPEMRAVYDATGSDRQAPSLDMRARDVMLKIWQHYVMEANPGVKPLNYMRESLTASIDQAQRMLKRFDQVAAHRGKLRTKSEDAVNLFECVLDEMQKQADQKRPQVQADLGAFRRAKEMLADYESTDRDLSGWVSTGFYSNGVTTA